MVVIILGVLASVVIPQIADASDSARSAATKLQLVTIRGQLQRYYMEHSSWPMMVELNSSWSVMTDETDIIGVLDEDGGFGPYLQGIPFNIYNNQSQCVATGPGSATSGWIYDEDTGQISAVGFDEVNGKYSAP